MGQAQTFYTFIQLFPFQYLFETELGIVFKAFEVVKTGDGHSCVSIMTLNNGRTACAFYDVYWVLASCSNSYLFVILFTANYILHL